jgi:hypothetical protein
MEINKDIFEVLKEFKINKDEGLLYLLGVFYKLDVEKVCSEEVIKAMALTKIVDKNYTNGLITWNMPLFQGQQTEWDWVKEWNNKWNIQKDRKASNPDCIKRMQEFFKKYPSYRAEDIMRATEMYMKTVSIGYLKNSAAFIFDGAGASKKSILLGWCEKLKEAGSTSNLKGKIIT